MQRPNERIVLTERDILRRLEESQVTKQADFKKIIKNLQVQSERLHEDLAMLKEKVKELKYRHKKKIQQQSRRQRNDPNKQFTDVREQLNARYQQLAMWQKKSQRSKQKLAIQVQYRDYINKCMSLQIQIQEELSILRIQKKNYKRLKKILRKQEKDETHILRKPTQIQHFNKQLKQKISIMKKIVASQHSSQIHIHSHKINMKQKQKQTINRLKFDKYQFHTQISQQTSQDESQSQPKQQQQSKMNSISEEKVQSYDKQKSEYQAIKKRIYSEMNRHQILQLSNHLKQQYTKLQNQVELIQQRIALQMQNKKMDPKYKRQGSEVKFIKQKQILLAKNKIIMLNMRSLDQKKIKALLDLKVHQKYYKPQLQVDQKNRTNRIKKNSMKTEAFQPEQEHNPMVKQMNRSKSQMKFNYKSKKQHTNSALLRLKTSVNSNQAHNIDDQLKSQRSFKRRKVSFNVKRQTKNEQTQTKNHFQEKEEGQNTNRIDFIGTLQINKLGFDDRIMQVGMKKVKNMCIQQLNVYVCSKGVSSIRAKYKQFPYSKGKVTSVDSFDNIEHISAYKLFQTNLPSNDHVKHIKLLYNKKTGCIKKIQILSNLNIRYEFGSPESHFPSPLQKQLKIKVQDMCISLDIGKLEYPSFLFGSYTNFGTMNVLAGLGFQINQQQ